MFEQQTSEAHKISAMANTTPAAEPLPGIREVRIVLGAAFFSWLALALLTFRASDPSLFHMMVPVEPVGNWCGAFGAHCAAFLYVLFGPAAWGTLLFAFFVIPQAGESHWRIGARVAAALGAIVSAGALFASIGFAFVGPISGGLLGSAALGLSHSIGMAGCVIAYSVVLVLSLLSFFRISFGTATRIVTAALLWGLSKMWAGLRTIGRVLWAGSSRLWQRSAQQEAEKQSAADDAWKPSGSGSSGAGDMFSEFEVRDESLSDHEVSSYEVEDTNFNISELETPQEESAEQTEEPAAPATGEWHSFMPEDDAEQSEEPRTPATFFDPVAEENIAEADAADDDTEEVRSADSVQPAAQSDDWHGAQSDDGAERYFDLDQDDQQDDADMSDEDGTDESSADEKKKITIEDDGFDFATQEHAVQEPEKESIRAAEQVTEEEVEEEEAPIYEPPPVYTLPDIALFKPSDALQTDDEAFMASCQERGRVLEEKLAHFGISGRVVGIHPGPVITLFEYEPDVGSKVSKIVALEDDLAMSLKALSIRIIAPVPGKCVVGFEIANESRSSVLFADVIASNGLHAAGHQLPIALGSDIVGKPVIADLATMPHLLVAGATGAGKSVGMNVMLVSLLASMSPDKVRMILIDPKRLEFAPYADVPHLLFPIVTSPYEVAPVLKWVVQEMEMRYEVMAQAGVRNIADYHKLDPAECFELEHNVGIRVKGMPYMVIMIDELADLMMVASKEIETLIARIAQMARAAGIHMIVATQRPSVDVVTGLIKANFPSRIAFRVSTKIDSRTIIDGPGAEKLLGKGDMLYLSPTNNGVQRLHGAYVTDQEINSLNEYLKAQREVEYFSLRQVIAQHSDQKDEESDPLYDEVCEYLATVEEISISSLQRKYRVGFNRSARLIEMLERDGHIAPAQGSKPRRVLRND